MAQKTLKDDLENSIITFNQRVILTDLMDEYELPFTQVENFVQSHIEEQEKKNCIKCEKRYLINGQDEESGNEIYTVVPQEQLDVWLKKLKDSECKLYSVELVGGSKTAAQEVKPMRYYTIGYKDSKKAASKQNGNPKEDIKKPTIVKHENNAKKEVLHNQNTVKTEEKKEVLEKKKTSPIKNKKPLKDKDQIVKKLTSPKKVNDFFKKKSKPATTAPNPIKSKHEANSSMQLFEEEEEPKATEVASSDEEEMLDAMRREINNDNNDEVENKHKQATGGPKRRRIIDSDDDEDEQPQAKQEKQENATALKSETYLDEDGFVLTIKPKKNAVTATSSNKESNNKKSPPAKKSSPLKTKSKTPKKPPPKTKQGNITSFFTKK